MKTNEKTLCTGLTRALLSLSQEKSSGVEIVVTYCVKKMMTCSPMIEQFFDSLIVASSDKEWL